jgi:hypothetical protein
LPPILGSRIWSLMLKCARGRSGVPRPRGGSFSEAGEQPGGRRAPRKIGGRAQAWAHYGPRLPNCDRAASVFNLLAVLQDTTVELGREAGGGRESGSQFPAA